VAEAERGGGERDPVGRERCGQDAPAVAGAVQAARDPRSEEVGRRQGGGEQAARPHAVGQAAGGAGREQDEADGRAGVGASRERRRHEVSRQRPDLSVSI
jgi:hypothetical protein